MSAFLDPTKPIATCTCESCEGCEAGQRVHCHFHARDLVHFALNALPLFLLGGAGIVHLGWGWLVPWLVAIISYFFFVEIRVMCAHCPHYAEAGGTLRCWANYGAPKIWKYRPGPMSKAEKVIFVGGLILIGGYPLVLLLIGRRWFLLVVYVLSLAGAASTLRMFLCSRCMNFACPLNTVDERVRQAFFERNPAVAQAWKQQT